LLVVYASLLSTIFTATGEIYEAYQVINKTDGQEITNQFGFAPAPVYKKNHPSSEEPPVLQMAETMLNIKEKTWSYQSRWWTKIFPMFSFPS
jgi:hypothetical protein